MEESWGEQQRRKHPWRWRWAKLKLDLEYFWLWIVDGPVWDENFENQVGYRTGKRK